MLQLQAKPSGGAPPHWFRHEPAPNRRPRSTAGRSPAPPPGSCARSRSTGTPTAPRRRPAARSPPPCSRPPARTHARGTTGTVTTQWRRRRERTGQITNIRSACLRDGARVDPVKRAAEDLAVAEAEAELLLGRLLRKIARGNRPHRAAQPPRRLVPPRRCTHQLTRGKQNSENPARASPAKTETNTSEVGRANRTGFLGPAGREVAVAEAAPVLPQHVFHHGGRGEREDRRRLRHSLHRRGACPLRCCGRSGSV